MKSKKCLALIVVAVFIYGAANATQLIDPPSGSKVSSITVFVAKKIVTMDPSIPNATAVAVADGRILSVGSLEDLKPWTDKYPTQINREFADKVIYPGFIEPHAHTLMGGTVFNKPMLFPAPMPNPWGAAFPGVPNLQAAMTALKKYSSDIKDPNQMLLAWGWDEVSMGRAPDRQLLDQVSATRPIIIWNASGRNFYANSGAINHYGITAEKAKGIPGVEMDKNGQLNGQFLDVTAAEFLMSFAGKDIMNPSQMPRDYLYMSDLMQQAGITTTGELSFGSLDLDMELKMAREFSQSSAGSMRVVPVLTGEIVKAKYGDKAVEEALNFKKYDNERLIFQGVKFFSDAGYMPETMHMGHPTFVNGSVGGPSTYANAKEFASTMKPWWDAGFHIHVHSNGDVGNQDTLNALQLLQDSKPRFDHRFTVNHFGVPSTAMVFKIKALNAVVSANISYISQRAKLQYPAMGIDRASTATRLGMLVRNGIVTSIHSDAPVSAPNPLQEAWSVVTRKDVYNDGKVWAPAEALPPSEAMKMITINAAYTLGVEDKVGSIEAGKYADFVVLGDDPQSVPSLKIKDIPISATILGGRVIPVSETSHPRPLK